MSTCLDYHAAKNRLGAHTFGKTRPQKSRKTTACTKSTKKTGFLVRHHTSPITSSAIFSAPHGAIMSSSSRCLPAKRPSFPTCSTATVFQAFMRTQMRAIFFFFFFDFYLLFCNEPKKNPSSFGAPKASSRALRGRPIPPRAGIDDQTTSFSILLHRSALDTTCTKTIMGLFFF